MEKKDWEIEKKLIQIKHGLPEVVSLNVGGYQKIMVSQNILCSVPESTLAKLFSGNHELKKTEDGSYFLDRDGKTFNALVNYLRNNRRVFPEFTDPNDKKLFQEEMLFWNIKDDRIEERRTQMKFSSELVEIL